jgi:hypothetical protein
MDDEDSEALVTVVARPSERTASETARTLVEQGLGATVAPITVGADGAPIGGAPSGFGVQVLHHDVERACELLGVELPAEVVAAMPEEKLPTPPWKRILVIWAIAMVTIPVAAGFAAYLLLSH